MRVVTIFASTFSQIERGGIVYVKELRHAIAVVKMRMAQNTHINFRKLHTHHASVFSEQVRGSRIEQVTFVLKFYIHRQAPLAKKFAGTTTACDVVNENLDFHLLRIR